MISKIRKELCKVLVKTPLWSTKRYFLIILLSTISTLKSIFRKVFWAAVTFLMVFVRGIPPHILCNTVIFPWTQKGCDWFDVKRFPYFSHIVQNLWMMGQGFIHAVIYPCPFLREDWDFECYILWTTITKLSYNECGDLEAL